VSPVSQGTARLARTERQAKAGSPIPEIGVSAMLRRPLSFMLTGLVIAVPILLTAYAAQTDWLPHKIVLIAVVTVASAGIMTLIDQLALDRR
jgi:hypothetical protein